VGLCELALDFEGTSTLLLVDYVTTALNGRQPETQEAGGEEEKMPERQQG
jgi:hypothetical protein